MATPTQRSTGRMKRPLAITFALVAGAALLLAGVWIGAHHTGASAAGTPVPMAPIGSMRGMGGSPSPSASTASTSLASAGSPEPEVDLAPEDLKKAQIRLVQAALGTTAATLRTPGTVKADEYTEVHVTPLAGGVVKRVPVLLGQHVRRGQPLAVLFSGELADAEAAYLSHWAEFEADHKRLERTQTLLQLGAASRQEEEEVEAAHAGHGAAVQAARERLELLGANSRETAALRERKQIHADLVVPAPIGGVVLVRNANLGLVATPAQELFTVADLSRVWVMASLNEKDFASVRVGSPATITAPPYPGRTWKGRVVYIQPQVDPTTRTAQARIEMANPQETLRIDMYVDVDFATHPSPGLVVPQTAVQAIGDKEYVFLPVKDSEGSFTVREVKIGAGTGTNTAVLSGLRAGEPVVTDGSFILKAEAVRQHPELQQ